MAFNEQTYQDIQDYLDHKMSPSAQQAFERKLSANEALAKEVQLHAEMQELFADTPENQLRKSLQVLSDEAEEERPGLSWKWFAMIPLLIGLVGFLMYQSSSNSKQSTTNNSTTESPAVPSSNELSTTNQDKQNINLESIQLTDNGDVTSPNIKGTTNTVPSVSPLVTGIAPTAYTAPSIVFLRKDLPSIIDDNKKGFFVLDSMQNAPDTINMVKDTIQKEPIADVGELVPIIETPNIIDPTTSSYINAPEEPFVMVLSAPVGSDTPFEDNVYLDSIIASQATSPAPFVSVLSTPADTLYYYVGKLGGVEKAKYADTLAAKLRMQIELNLRNGCSTIGDSDSRFILL